ncbi:MAG: hypothetical protein GW789_10060 [Ignavibacteria bacterium]|nr:hypothetical protein [Ignavibacteria bacterium]
MKYHFTQNELAELKLKGSSKNPLANGLTNGIGLDAAKPNFRRTSIKVFRDALK